MKSFQFIFFLFCFLSIFSFGEIKSIEQDTLLNDILTKQVILGDPIYRSSKLPVFYAQNNYKLVWNTFMSSNHKYLQLLNILHSAEDEGFFTNHYHINILEMYKRNITNLSIGTRSKLDVLLSDAFLLLFQHQYFGEISNTEMNRDWECWNYQINLSQLLFQAIQNDNLSETFLELSPPYPQYLMLKKGLNKYRKIVQQFPDSQKLKDNIETISINMERWRWLPKLKKPLYILVNIPAYQLMLYQKDSTVITMKTIVGESDHATPTFNCEITYVVLHPRWNIPNSIVKNEILPAIKEEKGYLLKNNMVVKHSWRISDTNVVVIDSSFWNTIFQSKFPYKLVQLPGPTNPLGDIKFMFPNQFNVYLHDTPNRYLFERDVRMFSHGCIRIEKPLELGALLLQNDSILQLSDADRFFAPNEKRRLSKPIPISINYWTAWADEEGNIQFYPDIYLKDNLLKEEIRKTSFCN